VEGTTLASKMTKPETAQRAADAPGSEADRAIDECLFCHRPADRVTFVVRDPEHRYNVCTDCLDDCARTVACSCVC
jgi:hypothetical protein